MQQEVQVSHGKISPNSCFYCRWQHWVQYDFSLQNRGLDISGGLVGPVLATPVYQYLGLGVLRHVFGVGIYAVYVLVRKEQFMSSQMCMIHFLLLFPFLLLPNKAQEHEMLSCNKWPSSGCFALGNVRERTISSKKRI